MPQSACASSANVVYLSGKLCDVVLDDERFGVLLTPLYWRKQFGERSGVERSALARITWAADTGCFRHPETFDTRAYLDWLDELAVYRATCLFATAPDVVGDARATWRRARHVLPRIRAHGYYAALVAQDGIEDTRIAWDTFDVLFIGGTDAWKLSEVAYALVSEASARGKRVHVGRVNSYKRLAAFAQAGASSADGTFLRFGPTTNGRRAQQWMSRLERQPFLWRDVDGSVA